MASEQVAKQVKGESGDGLYVVHDSSRETRSAQRRRCRRVKDDTHRTAPPRGAFGMYRECSWVEEIAENRAYGFARFVPTRQRGNSLRLSDLIISRETKVGGSSDFSQPMKRTAEVGA